MSPENARTRLENGNERFVESRAAHPHQSPERRKEISGGQHPFAAILTCSDSRVVPEILFDQGLGDLLVVRIARNIVDDAVLDTMEYGAAHLDVPLIVVLGHTRCGAVAAAVSGASSPRHMRALHEALEPAVRAARNDAGDAIDNASRRNVILQVERLRRAGPKLAELCEARRLHIVGAMYDIETGAVDWLPE